MTVAHASRPRRWRNTALVYEQDRRRSRGLWLALLGLVSAIVPVAVYLVQQGEYVQLRYRIDEVRRQTERFEKAEQTFRIERARLQTPAEIESRAEEIGLVRPVPSEIVVVRAATPEIGNLMARAPDAPEGR